MGFKNQTFAKLVTGVTEYRNNMEKNKQEEIAAPHDYIGERLAATRKRLAQERLTYIARVDKAFQTARETWVTGITTRRDKAAALGEANKLDPAKKSPDYALLALPTKLEKDELQTLYNRNWADPIFVRALDDYIEQRNTLPIEHINPFDKATISIETILTVFKQYTGTGSNAGGGINDLLLNAVLDDPKQELLNQWDEEIQAAINAI